MKIEILRAWGADYREIGFFDHEDDETVAYSGLLDREDAIEFAARLRDIAHNLATWAQEERGDDAQILLPLPAGVGACR